MPLPALPQRRPACLSGRGETRIDRARSFDLSGRKIQRRRLGNACFHPLAGPYVLTRPEVPPTGALIQLVRCVRGVEQDVRPVPAGCSGGGTNIRSSVPLRAKECPAVVETKGLEPSTPCLQSRCATNCATSPGWTPDGPQSGTESVARDHSLDSVAGRRALRSPTTAPTATSAKSASLFMVTSSDWRPAEVGLRGLEPLTSSLSGKRSNQAEL